eukprot:TRINITY_DN3951_c0_g1_i8.p1 TRINITY_DN3951_c0_g1~~TRINITY_DN3951_c0_g1_i8.p1  ORF type:complete len:778 (+),score=112.28 TRINITY_DN3951_c0_g1_i8:130-2463(+)
MVKASSIQWDTGAHASDVHVMSSGTQEVASTTSPTMGIPTCEAASTDSPSDVLARMPYLPGTLPSSELLPPPPLHATPPKPREGTKDDAALRLPLAMLQLLLPELSNHVCKETEGEIHSEVQQLTSKLKHLEQRLLSSSDLPSAGCCTIPAIERQDTKHSDGSKMAEASAKLELQRRRTKAKLRDPRYSGTQVLTEMFRDLDLDYSGTVDRDELVQGLHRLGVEGNMAQQFLSGLDNKSGIISFADWRQFVEDSQHADLLDDLKGKFIESRLHSDSSPFSVTVPAIGTQEQPRWMLLPDSKFRCTFDAIIMAFCFYLVVSLPFLVAFDSYLSEGINSGLDALHFSIDVLFLLDLCLNFRTGMIVGAQVVMHPRIVTINYLRGWFLLDLVSSVPFETISQGAIPTFRVLKLMKLTKLTRILRFLKPLREMQESLLDGVDSATRLRGMLTHGNLVLLGVLICHWLACGMAIADRGWLQNYQDVNESLLRVYLAALYWSMTTMTTVGYGDIVPTADSERGFSIFAMVVGGAFYGYLVGTITDVVASVDLNNQKYKERMSLVFAFVDHYKMPPQMRKRVVRYFRGISAEKSAQSLGELTSELSPSLLKEMSCYLVNHDILHHPLFTNVPFNALIRVEALAKIMLVEAGSVLACEGDAGTAMFIITAGTCRLELDDSRIDVTQTTQETLLPGESFGEEIITGLCDTYMYQVTAITNCRLLMIEEGTYMEAFEYMPTILETMKGNAIEQSIYARHFSHRMTEAMQESHLLKAQPWQPSPVVAF